MRTLPLLVLVAVFAAFAGCSLLPWSGPPRAAVESIRVLALPGANSNTATALDIVFVQADGAVALLPRSGPEWFARKAELTAALAGGVDVVSLQIPPATPTTSVTLPPRHGKALRVFVFANYIEKAGQAAADLTRFRRLAIRLRPETIDYAEGDGAFSNPERPPVRQ